MRRKAETVFLFVCTLLLSANGLNATPSSKLMNPLGFNEYVPVPEPGFWMASGVFTVAGAIGLGVVKAYRAVVGRKRD